MPGTTRKALLDLDPIRRAPRPIRPVATDDVIGRATVLDRYFIGIETEVIDKPMTFDGAPLMDRLAAR